MIPRRWIGACLDNRPVVLACLLLLLGWGLMVAPFEWDGGLLPRHPVPVDAFPDLGENQQIVFTEWPGHSPQDVEDQVTYPLAAALMGTAGVETVRSVSAFGFSSIHLVFREDVDFHWSRTRILERLGSLPQGSLPEGARAALGPDATALGQVFWYTLEGRDEEGNPAGGWSLEELRSIQDWQVRLALSRADGVSEVASVGGHIREYQIDVDPDLLQIHGLSLGQVIDAARKAHRDVGARTIEVNRVEYLIRGLGFVRSVEDIRQAVIGFRDGVPIQIRHVAHVDLGPAVRRGALDKEGIEAVGGVVTARYGENPLATIQNVRREIDRIAASLPSKILEDGTRSQVAIVPFYDRSVLIRQTLGTLDATLVLQILVTLVVVILMVRHLMGSLLVSGLLPLAVLGSFAAMKGFGIQADIVALSGIAIAIGTMVDMGIVLCENIVRRLKEAGPGVPARKTVLEAAQEVAPAVLVGAATTVASFLPVFALTEAEGRMFRPLAYTKTFALLAAALLAVSVLPPLALSLLGRSSRPRRWPAPLLLGAAGLLLMARSPEGPHSWIPGAILLTGGIGCALAPRGGHAHLPVLLCAVVLLAQLWLPLGPEGGLLPNLLATVLLIGAVLLPLLGIQRVYRRLLEWCLQHRIAALLPALLLLAGGALAWLGADRLLGWLPSTLRSLPPYQKLASAFPGLGREFLPALDEGAFLYMPTTMPHASIGEALDSMRLQNLAISGIPEVSQVVGKVGRAATPLDPAPVSMVETVINYHPEFLEGPDGEKTLFAHSSREDDLFRDPQGDPLAAPDGKPYRVRGTFQRDSSGALAPDPRGRPFRLWRPALDPDLNPDRGPWPGIRTEDDIWEAIADAARIPGSTPAPRLQPIAARIVMLQTGLRSPFGIRIQGPDLESIEEAAVKMEQLLRRVPSVRPATVVADRMVGKPYLEIGIDREAIAQHGLSLHQVQEVIETGIGGKRIFSTIEGRERYPVRVRYLRELRDQIESLAEIPVATPAGARVPLGQLAEIGYRRGPQSIRSEDTFLTGYLVFDGQPGVAEADVAEDVQRHLQAWIGQGELVLPPSVAWSLAGNYENQIRSEARLRILLPLALLVILLLLHLHFRSFSCTLLVFSSILVAWAGGFLCLWLWGQPWFLDFSILGVHLGDLLQVRPVNLSVAVWIGFLSLFGIASDNGVLLATFLTSRLRSGGGGGIAGIRRAALEAGTRRIRPALMTTATTLIALLPVLTSTGRGSEIMIPMAIPMFGGMAAVTLSLLAIPAMFCAEREFLLRTKLSPGAARALSLGTLFIVPILACSWGELQERRRQAEQGR